MDARAARSGGHGVTRHHDSKHDYDFAGELYFDMADLELKTQNEATTFYVTPS